MFDKVQLPLVAFAYHTPPALTQGDAECDLLASVLADGKSSRLYKRLVIDDKIAASVSASNASQALGSFLRIDVQARAGADLGRVEKAVDEEIARLLAGGHHSRASSPSARRRPSSRSSPRSSASRRGPTS